MKKSILTFLIAIISIASFSQLSIAPGWNAKWSKQFPKMGKNLPGQWEDPMRQEMKYTMQIVEDPRTNKVFVNLSGTDNFRIYKFNDFNFNLSMPTNTYTVWKSQSFGGGSYFQFNTIYEKTIINNVNYLSGDTFVVNQSNYETGSYQVTHPFMTSGVINLLLSNSVIGYQSPYGTNWKSYFFTKNNPYRIKHTEKSSVLNLHTNDMTLSGSPVHTIQLTCPFTSTTFPNKVSFQYKDQNTMYVKYIETYTLNSSSNWSVDEMVKSIWVDTVSINNGSLTIGNYFNMTGLEQYPTLSFEYSQIYCKDTEIYMTTSNSDTLGQFGPQFSNSIPVFGTNVQFAVPYVFCFSTATSVITSIANKKEEITEPKLYPNPTNGQFTISFKSVNHKEFIKIYSITGQEIYQTEIESEDDQFEHTVNIECNPGIYFAKFGNKTIKFIKQ